MNRLQYPCIVTELKEIILCLFQGAVKFVNQTVVVGMLGAKMENLLVHFFAVGCEFHFDCLLGVASGKILDSRLRYSRLDFLLLLRGKNARVRLSFTAGNARQPKGSHLPRAVLA